MSYTPDSELLEDRARAVISAMDSLQEAMRNRRRNRSEWNSAHLDHLKEVSKQMIDLEEVLLKLAEDNR